MRTGNLYKTPLPYPGGKRLGLTQIMPFVPYGVEEMVSPFFGGGSVEFACLNRGIKVYGYDLFTPLVEFWQELIKDNNKLCETVGKYHPCTQKVFTYLFENGLDFESKTERAAAFYVLTRCSYGNFAYNRKNMSRRKKDRDFHKNTINKLRETDVKDLEVGQLHWNESLSKHRELFAYLDPPYYFKEKSRAVFYGFNGELHREFDHEGLRDELNEHPKWILSYNNVPEVRDFYKNYRQIPLTWAYSISKNKSLEGNELLILSDEVDTILKSNTLF